MINQARDEATVRLMVWLFARMAQERDCDREELVHSVVPAEFLAWADRYLALQEDAREHVRPSNTTDEGYEFFRQLLAAPDDRALAILPVWHQVLLAHRGPPRYPLAHLQLAMLLTWEDGVVAPITVTIPAATATGPLTDALVATQVLRAQRIFVAEIESGGLDRLHNECGANFGGQEALSALWGALVEVGPKLPAKLRHEAWRYVQLFRALVDPQVPEEAVRLATAARAKAEGDAAPPVGGWDT